MRYNDNEFGDFLARKQGRPDMAQSFYITLAKESPSRPSAAEDSEDAMYDSDLHGRETGTYIVHSHIGSAYEFNSLNTYIPSK